MKNQWIDFQRPEESPQINELSIKCGKLQKEFLSEDSNLEDKFTSLVNYIEALRKRMGRNSRMTTVNKTNETVAL